MEIKILLIAFLGLAPSCTSEKDGSLPPEDLGQAAAQIVCARVFSCCDAEERASGKFEPATSFPTLDDCLTGYADLYQSAFVDPRVSSQELGRVAYREDNARECVDTVSGGADCNEFFYGESFDPCETLFDPLVADDAPCFEDFECVSDYCVGKTEDAEGVCEALPEEGELCPQRRCSDETFCNTETNDKTGGGMLICREKRLDGQQCEYSGQCTNDVCFKGECMKDAPVCDGL